MKCDHRLWSFSHVTSGCEGKLNAGKITHNLSLCVGGQGIIKVYLKIHHDGEKKEICIHVSVQKQFFDA